MHCGVLSSLPSLYPWDASRILPLSCDNQVGRLAFVGVESLPEVVNKEGPLETSGDFH